jgi:heptosyltransferase-2
VPNILVVAPSWIGDTLLAQPLFARLREKFPGVEIDALAPGWTAPVLRRMPEIDEVIEAPFGHGELKLSARRRLGRALRPRGYSEAIVLPNTFKSALVPFFAAIPRRTGFVGELRYGLLNVVHKLNEEHLPLMVERYAQLAETRSRRRASRSAPAGRRGTGLSCSPPGAVCTKPVATFAGAEYVR